MFKFFQNFVRHTSGATAIEYSLIAATISIILAVVAFLFGDQLALMFNNMTGITEAMNNSVDLP